MSVLPLVIIDFLWATVAAVELSVLLDSLSLEKV